MAAEQSLGIQFFEPKPYFTKGGQGKMFRDPKPKDAVRYPRGYTPERMRDVRSLPLTVKSAGDEGPFTGHAGESQIHQTIARSTLPLQHFDNEPDYEGFNLHVVTGEHMGAAGQFRSWGARTMGAHGEIGISKHSGYNHVEEPAQTLMHELGHHMSYRTRQPHSNPQTPAQSGKEEAFADDTMVKYWRADPRNVRDIPAVNRGSGRDPSLPHAVYEHRGAWDRYGGNRGHETYLRSRKTPLTYKPWFGPQHLQLSLFKDRRD